jgi:hypothetical protein
MAVMWKYPPEIMAELQKPLPAHVREEARQKLSERHAETLARIDARIAGAVAEERERREALAWCRANGNPHRADASNNAPEERGDGKLSWHQCA